MSILGALLTATRRSIENPAVPLSSPRIMDYLGLSGDTASGEAVTRETVVKHPAVFAGIRLVSETTSGIPIEVYRRGADDSRERDRSHPASRVLRKLSNPWTKAKTFLSTMVSNALLHRGGYAQIHRSADATPLALEWLHPEHTYPVLTIDENGNKRLLYQTSIQGRNRVLDAMNVFHVRGIGWDGLDGYSLIDKLKESVGLGLATLKYANVFFANNAQPSLVIQFPGYLKDELAIERFRASWADKHAGTGQAHRPAILEGGATIQPWGISQEDSQFLETREFNAREIAAILGLPPHLLGDTTRTSRASLQEENQSLLDNGIDPWLREIETESEWKLLTTQQYRSDSHFVEFTRGAFVRANLQERYAAYGQAINDGWRSRAEIRRIENLNVEDDELEKYLFPLNMAVVGEAPAEQDTSGEDEGSVPDGAANRLAADRDQRLQRTLEATVVALWRRVARSAERATRSPAAFRQWLADLEKLHLDVFTERLEPTTARARDLSAGLLETVRLDLKKAQHVPAIDLPQAVQQTLAALAEDQIAGLVADIVSEPADPAW